MATADEDFSIEAVEKTVFTQKSRSDAYTISKPDVSTIRTFVYDKVLVGGSLPELLAELGSTSILIGHHSSGFRVRKLDLRSLNRKSLRRNERLRRRSSDWTRRWRPPTLLLSQLLLRCKLTAPPRVRLRPPPASPADRLRRHREKKRRGNAAFYVELAWVGFSAAWPTWPSPRIAQLSRVAEYRGR
jgi:hypothetical protein